MTSPLRTGNHRLTWAILWALWALVLLGGGGWANWVAGELRTLRDQQRQTEQGQAGSRTDIEVIREKVQQIDRRMERQEAALEAQGKKLDQIHNLLRGRAWP